MIQRNWSKGKTLPCKRKKVSLERAWGRRGPKIFPKGEKTQVTAIGGKKVGPFGKKREIIGPFPFEDSFFRRVRDPSKVGASKKRSGPGGERSWSGGVPFQGGRPRRGLARCGGSKGKKKSEI